MQARSSITLRCSKAVSEILTYPVCITSGWLLLVMQFDTHALLKELYKNLVTQRTIRDETLKRSQVASDGLHSVHTVERAKSTI